MGMRIAYSIVYLEKKTKFKGVMTDKNSVLKILGLRFNYITNVGATYLYNKLTSNKTKVE